MIELSKNKSHSLGAVPNITVELIPQATHPTHPPPLPLFMLSGASPCLKAVRLGLAHQFGASPVPPISYQDTGEVASSLDHR